MTSKCNVYGVFIGDIFLLNYYGTRVFFCVVKTDSENVYLTELETRKEGAKEFITHYRDYAKKPYIIKKKNNLTYTEYKVVPVLFHDEPYLPIKIDIGSDLYKEAQKENEYVKWGTFYATRIDNAYSYYFKRKLEA